MAPESPVASKSSNQLRLVSVANFIPAFCLCIADASVNNELFPALGLVFVLTSAVGSLLINRHAIRNQDGAARPSAIGRAGIFLFDVLHAAVMLVMIILTWVLVGWHRNAALAAYATVPLIVDMTVHSFIISAPIVRAMQNYISFWLSDSECPHCHMSLSSRPAAAVFFRGERYAAIPASPEPADLYTDDRSDDGQTIVIRPSFDEIPADNVEIKV